MHLGDDSNFLEIIPTPDAGIPGIFAVRAQISDSLSECTLRNQGVVFDLSEFVREKFEQFVALSQSSFLLPAGGQGSITLSRSLRGSITISFRISSWEAVGFIEGKIIIDGEYSTGLIQEFRRLISSV